MNGREQVRRRWGVVLCLVAVLVGACAAPALANVETEIEEGLGRLMAEAFCRQRGVLDQPLLQDWVEEIGRQIVTESPRKDLHHHFIILDSPESNAFALPGGYVFVTAGLLESLSCEDELAAIMAHEAAHLANRDFQRMLKRQLMFIAFAAILRHNEEPELVNLTYAVQVVNTLRHSRRREAQADAVGVKLATQAGYDARGLTHFLSRIGAGRWSYLETVFSTHPHPTKRIAWIDLQLQELRSREPEQMLAVAEALVARGRYSAAAEALEGLGGPASARLAARRETLLGEVALARGDGPTAGRHFTAALRLAPDDERARAGKARAEQMQPGAPVAWDGLSREQTAALEGAEAEVGDSQEAARGASRAAWQHLRALWRNRQVARALELAQVFDPELRDPAYLCLVAQTWDMLNQVVQGSNLVARTLSLRDEVAGGLGELCRDLPTAQPGTEQGAGTLLKLTAELPETGPPAAKGSVEAAGQLARVARGYERSAASLAPILLELLAAGEGDPLGRLVFSRFAVLQTQVALNQRRLHRLHREAWEEARAAWLSDLELRRMRLNLMGAAAPPPGRDICVRLIGRQLRESEEVVASEWDRLGALGDATLALARQQLGLVRGAQADDAPSNGAGPPRQFSPELRALRITLRISELEVSAEQVRSNCPEKTHQQGSAEQALCCAGGGVEG